MIPCPFFIYQDTEGLKETADFYGVSPVCIERVAHDMMLDCEWEKGAKVIGSWLNNLKETVPPSGLNAGFNVT